MENANRKWVNLSYLAAAGLVSYVFFWLAFRLTGIFDLEARVRNLDLVIRGGSLALGGICFLALYRNAQANTFMEEVVLELSKVTWPAPKDARSATLIVIIMVLISGVILGFLDYLWTSVMQWVL